jgi:hypothetical protein
MPIRLSRPSWRQLLVPLLMTFGFPFVVPVMIFAQTWVMPGTFPYATGLVLISLLSAYIYFPLATASRRFFSRNNTLKSVFVGISALEIFRQLLISVHKASGVSFSTLIQQHCDKEVETFQAAVACGAAVSATLLWCNLLFWLLPAVLLCSISRRRLTTQAERSEA